MAGTGSSRAFISQLDAALQAAANPQRAPAQQAYMKSAMPFLGITAPELRQLCAAAHKAHPFTDRQQWIETVMALWRGARYRERRYAALDLLQRPGYRHWLDVSLLPQLEELIVSGAWWDYVDTLAVNQFGSLLRQQPDIIRPLLRDWSVDDDLWKRRTAILAQLKFKADTDPQLLFELIEPSLPSREFFLRKAIGWALREYSKTDAGTVIDYVNANGDRLSGLSQREALKVLRKRGQVSD